MIQNTLKIHQFDWTSELERTVLQSLTTTFGLDFLLLQDKQGGDVNTIHNIRGGICDTEDAKEAYKNRGDYDSKKYHHKDDNYKNRGNVDTRKHQRGELFDTYRGKNFSLNEKRQLDHIISAKEIHDDAGRVLADLDGVKLANQDSNLQSTLDYINTAKSKHSIEKCLNEIFPRRITCKKESIKKYKEKLNNIIESNPQDVKRINKLENEISRVEVHIKKLQSIDKAAIKRADKIARAAYNLQINQAYYMGSKFLKNTGSAAAMSGIKMGTRQVLGLVLAEVWFELKVELPKLYQEISSDFDFKKFLYRLKQIFKNIWERVKAQFKDFLSEFSDGMVGGIFSSITTTLLNIFFTTEKLIGKLIREMWQTLVKVAKLIFFNPEKLSFGQLAKEAIRLLSFAVVTFSGVILNQQLAQWLVIPFGTEIASFISALATGLMTIGMVYFIDYSPLMQKIWAFLDQFKTKYQKILEHYQAINAELDRLLVELSKIEFNFDADELSDFTDSLVATNDELARSIILDKEIKRRGIDLPFEMGNSDSTRTWLLNRCKK